jgi:hypothetical protein
VSISAEYKTVSEGYFAAYLESAQYMASYEPDMKGQTTKPDFVFEYEGMQVICDVKERMPSVEQIAAEQLELESTPTGTLSRSRARSFDPVGEIRYLINEKRKKFKGYNDHLCALIFYNNGNRDVRFHPPFLFSAMIGDLGFRASISREIGVVDRRTIRDVFLDRGGSMIKSYRTGAYHESLRNISAICALESFEVANPEYIAALELEIQRRSGHLKRNLSGKERAGIVIDLITSGVRRTNGRSWGLTVCLNPIARVRFPDNVFNGPYDEHWELVGERPKRIIAGEHRLQTQDF